MKKILFCVEGRTELILIRDWMCKKFKKQLNLMCRDLNNDQLNPTAFDWKDDSPIIDIRVYNCESDTSVLSFVKERENSLANVYDYIICIRDMYCEQYNRETNGRIDTIVTQKYIDSHENRKLKMNSKINFFFSIMEVEAWLLGMHWIWGRNNFQLNAEDISSQIGHDIKTIDPEIEFFKPANQIQKILNNFGLKHKQTSTVDKISEIIEPEDYEQLADSNKCDSFKKLYTFLSSTIFE